MERKFSLVWSPYWTGFQLKCMKNWIVNMKYEVTWIKTKILCKNEYHSHHYLGWFDNSCSCFIWKRSDSTCSLSWVLFCIMGKKFSGEKERVWGSGNLAQYFHIWSQSCFSVTSIWIYSLPLFLICPLCLFLPVSIHSQQDLLVVCVGAPWPRPSRWRSQTSATTF